MTSDQEILIALASKFHDECVSPTELERLDVLLRVEEMRRLFVEFSNMHYGLRVQAFSNCDRELATKVAAVHNAIAPLSGSPAYAQSKGDIVQRTRDDRAPIAARVQSLRLTTSRRWNAMPRRLRALCVGIAASVILACGILSLGDRKAPPDRVVALTKHDRVEAPDIAITASAKPEDASATESQDFVARVLAATDDVTWQANGAPTDFLMRLETGNRIKLATGMLNIEFSGGAKVILHAPADLQILGSTSARLFSGVLSGHSSEGSFNVLTPAANVIDVGTEFGVAVDAAMNTDVSVFDGEVHLRPMPKAAPFESLLRLTQGMSARVDGRGIVCAGVQIDPASFLRSLPSTEPARLGASEVSLIDVISGGGVGEYRLAGSIDPATGHWGQPPWRESKGVEPHTGSRRFVRTEWNSLVDGVFIPDVEAGEIQVDSGGHSINLPKTCGATWGPIWARRRFDASLEPLAEALDENQRGFWGAGTIAAMLDRLRWTRDGLVGIHSNVGISLDLAAVKRQHGRAVSQLRGTLGELERWHESAPLYPDVRADFRVYVDGELRYERLGFRRRDGDSQFGVSLGEHDRFLTLVATDNDGSNTFDHVILIDPVLELAAH